MAARYWRLTGMRARAGGNLVISVIHWMSAGGRVDAGATVTSTHAPVSGSLAALNAAHTGAACVFAAADVAQPGFALVWDCGAAVDLDAMRIGAAAGAVPATWLGDMTLEFSADAVAWVGAWSTAGKRVWPVWPGAGGTTDVALPLWLGAAAMQLYMPADPATPGDASGNHAPQILGSTALSAAQGGSAGYSYYFDGVEGNAIRVPISSEASPLLFRGGDWTLAFKLWCDGVTPAGTIYGYVVSWAGGLNYSWPDLAVQIGIADANQFRLRVALASTSAGGGAPDISYFEDAPVLLNRRQWMRVSLTRSGSFFELRVDGVSIWTKTDSRPLRAVVNASGLAFGSAGYSNLGTPQEGLRGYLDDMLVLTGAAVSVPAVINLSGGLDARPARTHQQDAVVAASAAIDPPSAGTSRAVVACDAEFGGRGRIWGTTKTKGISTNVATKARVVLLHQRSKLPVRETWSDPTTGAFAFEGIDTQQEFLTLAEDAAGNFRPIAASRLVPEVQS